jgi:hypothetical protein
MRECVADEVRRADVRFPIDPHQLLVTRARCGVVKLAAFGCRFRRAAAAAAVASGRSKIPSPVLLS